MKKIVLITFNAFEEQRLKENVTVRQGAKNIAAMLVGPSLLLALSVSVLGDLDSFGLFC
jgi:hypothetical protein